MTNFSEIKKRVLKLKRMILESERGDFAKYTKKEAMQKEKEIEKLKKYYFGLMDLDKLPEVLVVVDPVMEEIAVKEAKDKDIDIVAISNTNANLEGIEFPIVANSRNRDVIKMLVSELFAECK